MFSKSLTLCVVQHDGIACVLTMATLRLKQIHAVLQRCAPQPNVPSRHIATHPEVIQVIPKVSLFDQKIQIKVRGLPCKAKVTLHASTQQEWRKKPVEFVSCGHFNTNGDGDLDLNTDASLGGTYTGIDPMGLFWSLKPNPAGPQNVRMVVRNGDDPVLYKLAIFLGHLSLDDLVSPEKEQKLVHSVTVTRLKRSADVRRLHIKEGNVRGTLFLPPGDGPHPGVIDMYGSSGGLMEIRASLLASHGFAVLALPFFKYEDLPESLDEVTMDQFEEAVSWFSSLETVKADGIGVVGTSTGGQFALLMARHCPQVKATVNINGQPFVYLYDLYRKDGSLCYKCVKADPSTITIKDNAVCLRNSVMLAVDPLIPVWESSAHVLNLVSDDDQQVNPGFGDVYHTHYPEEKRHLLEVVHYPRAGHLLEPPYIPFCKKCINPSFVMHPEVPQGMHNQHTGVDFLWGGNPIDHAAAQEASWNKILEFLKKHLC